MSEPKNSKDALEFIHTLDSLAIKKQKEEIERLCAWGRGLESDLSHARVEISFLKAEVERLKIDAYKKLSMRIEIDKLKARIEYLTNAGTANELRLKAEVERLRSASFVTAIPSDDYERVVKAGNALRDDLEALTKSTWFNKCKSVKNWNSATYQ